MEKARFTETQIVNILKLTDSGIKVEDICRQNVAHLRCEHGSVAASTVFKTQPHIKTSGQADRPRTTNTCIK